MSLYHHTDSARLPWILRDGVLKPGNSRLGGFPDDFLWATANPVGDTTASSLYNPAPYRDGRIAQVRFTLHEADFISWAEAKATHSRWSPRFCDLLEARASAAQIAQWFCRSATLDHDRWLALDFRTWRNPRWRPASPEVFETSRNGGLGVRLDSVVYTSWQHASPTEPTTYTLGQRLYVNP